MGEELTKLHRRRREGEAFDLPSTLYNLLLECQDIKAMNLGLLVTKARDGFAEDGQDLSVVNPLEVARLTRATVGVMDLELRVAQELGRLAGPVKLLPTALWRALMATPGVGPTLRQPKAREAFERAIRKEMDIADDSESGEGGQALSVVVDGEGEE